MAFSRAAAHAVAMAPVPTLVRAGSCMPGGGFVVGAGVQTGRCGDVAGGRGALAAEPQPASAAARIRPDDITVTRRFRQNFGGGLKAMITMAGGDDVPAMWRNASIADGG